MRRPKSPRPHVPSEPVAIEIVRCERTAAFRGEHEREALSTLWAFRVVWHEQRHELAATNEDVVVGVLGLRIAASLAHLEAPAEGAARAFLEACGYKTEAILPQHTWKRDVAVMRKFLL